MVEKTRKNAFISNIKVEKALLMTKREFKEFMNDLKMNKLEIIKEAKREQKIIEKEWAEKEKQEEMNLEIFPNSKVKNICYHGTSFNFNEFKINNASIDRDFGRGIYFTSSYEDAELYATDHPDVRFDIKEQTSDFFHVSSS